MGSNTKVISLHHLALTVLGQTRLLTFFLFIPFISYSQVKTCMGTLGTPIISQDFGSGNPMYDMAPLSSLGFSTTFKKWNKPVTDDGYYSIVNQVPNDFQINGVNVWLSGFDHTTGDGKGYMLLVNGDQNLGEFYRDTVTHLCLGSTYEFSSYLANIFKEASAFTPPRTSIPPRTRFEIRDLNGNILDSISSGNIPNSNRLTWTKYGITFTAPSSSIVLVMVSTASSGTGNDIVLDDIAFRPCKPDLSIVSPVSTCEMDNDSITATMKGNTGYNYSQWQISRDNGTSWNNIGSTLTYPGNSLDHVIELPLSHIPFADDNTLYRLILSTSKSYLSDPSSACNIISPSSLLRVSRKPLLKITDPVPVCQQTVNLAQAQMTAGSSLYNGNLSYFTSFNEAGDSIHPMSLAEASSIAVPGWYYIRASTPTQPVCSTVQGVLVTIDSIKKIGLQAPPSLCKDFPTFTAALTSLSNVKKFVWSSSSDNSVVQWGGNSLVLTPDSMELEKDSLWIKVSSADTVLACPNVKDSVKVIFFNPADLHLPKEAVFCEDAPVSNFGIQALVENNPTSVIWQSTNGSVGLYPLTGLTTSLQFTGLHTPFSIIATAKKLGCRDRSDTMDIRFVPLPIIDAGADTSVCSGTFFSRTLPVPSGLHYIWGITANGTWQDSISLGSTISFTPKATTKVTLTAGSALGCQTSDDFTIHVFIPPLITLPVQACRDPSLTLQPVVASYPPGGTFTWNKNNTLLNRSGDPSSLPISSNGTYTFEYNYQGCTSSASTFVTDPPSISLTNKVVCTGDSFILTAPYIQKARYFWNNGTASTSPTFTATASLMTDTITLKVVDSLGCQTTCSATAIGVPPPDFTLFAKEVCEGETGTVLATLGDPNLESQYSISYQWSIDLQNASAVTWKSQDFTNSGNYTLTLAIGDCQRTNHQYAVVHPLPVLNDQEKYTFCPETSTSLLLKSANTDPHTWYSENKVVGTTQNLEVDPDTNTTYLLVVEDVNGCRSSHPITVSICCAPRLFAPNVITPFSGDVNSSMKISGKYFTQFELTVFSRWGEVIYNSKDQTQFWDGRYREENMPIGVYAWMITYEGLCPEHKGPFKQVGDVTVLK
jgi:gliding motility-associated-like protein